MAGLTLQQAESQLSLYLAAETAVLAKQSYEIAGRKLELADLESIQRGITYWDNRVKILSRGRRSITVSPSF